MYVPKALQKNIGRGENQYSREIKRQGNSLAKQKESSYRR